jgi:nucleoid DNA-binding protein
MNFSDWTRATQQAIDDLPASQQIRDTHFSQAEIDHVLRLAISVLADELQQGGEVAINALGRFSVVERPPRMVVSNLPGQEKKKQQVPARRDVRFKPSPGLLAHVNSIQKEARTEHELERDRDPDKKRRVQPPPDLEID